MEVGNASRHRITLGALLISLCLHGGAYVGLQALPVRERTSTQVVEMKVVTRPRPQVEPEPLQADPPEAAPEVPKPVRERRRVVKKVPVKPREVPPPNQTRPAESAQDQPPPELVGGLTAESFGNDGGVSAPVFGAGNTLMVKPPDKMVKPEDVRPYTEPVDLADVSTEPRLLKTPTPEEVFGGLDYPPEAKENGVEGVAGVKLLVDETGRVQKVRAVKGPAELRAAAVALARLFRYEPATLNGQPVSVWWYAEIPFRLTD